MQDLHAIMQNNGTGQNSNKMIRILTYQ